MYAQMSHHCNVGMDILSASHVKRSSSFSALILNKYFNMCSTKEEKSRYVETAKRIGLYVVRQYK